MTDNNENGDLENLEMEGIDGVSSRRPGFVGNLREAWRTKPLFKLMVTVVAVGSLVAVIASFLAPEKPITSSAHVMTPPDMKQAPGGVVSPYMKQQTDLANKQRSEGALKNGGSALPTPQGRVADLGDLEKKQDPLTELKTETEHLKQELVRVQQAQNKPAPVPQPVQKNPENDALAQVMSKQMSQLETSWKAHGGVKAVTVFDPKTSSGSSGSSGSGGNSSSMTNASYTQQAKTLVPAGTVSYAQLLTEANSDVPGPILAQIVSGPLAGARVVGNFKTMDGYLVLQFNLANMKGKDIPISAYALDPDTTLPGMATEVDNRYFLRVVLPSAAAFLEGLGDALGTPPSTTTTTSSGTLTSQGEVGMKTGMYQGLGKAANVAGAFFQAEGQATKQLVRIASGTPMGIFFVTTVKEPLDASAQMPGGQPYYKDMGQGGYYASGATSGYNGQQPYGQQAYGQQPYGQTYRDVGQGNYPNTTISGYGGQQANTSVNPNVPPEANGPTAGYSR